MSNSLLEGLRICDLTGFWSGPSCTAYLGSVGAEVIKIESIQRPDGFRFAIPANIDHHWEVYGPWNSMNVNKSGITLDLTRPRGTELFKRLVAVCDVVVENFSARVMEGFGLTYPVLKQVKPDIIMVSMPGYGTYGPWRDYIGFGPIFEHVSGWAYITGYPDRPPITVGGASDPVAGMLGAFAILAALEHRRDTGKGQFIDMSQVEAGTTLLGPALIDYSLNHRVWERVGNRHPLLAPHGVYRCKGVDNWIAISVSSNNEWKALCKATANADWAVDRRFATPAGRRRNAAELDRLIESWTVDQEYYRATDTLQKAGVAAGAVTKPSEGPDEPHFKATGFYVEMDRDFVGKQAYPVWPFRFSDADVTMKPAPKLGEHNDHVMRTILGISRSELEQLEKDKIIGTKPIGG